MRRIISLLCFLALGSCRRKWLGPIGKVDVPPSSQPTRNGWQHSRAHKENVEPLRAQLLALRRPPLLCNYRSSSAVADCLVQYSAAAANRLVHYNGPAMTIRDEELRKTSSESSIAITRALPVRPAQGTRHAPTGTVNMQRTAAMMLMLPSLSGFSRYHASGSRSLLRSPAAVRMESDAGLDEEALDALVRKEIEMAFAGMEEKFANSDDDEALEILQKQSKSVLENVFAKFEADGQLLSSSLASKGEDLAAERSAELLERFDQEIAPIMSSVNSDREIIRSEMKQLESLNKELQELQAGGGGSVSRNTIVGGAAFLVGLTGLGAAINEVLKINISGSGDLATVGLNAALGIAGVLIYLQKKSS